MNYREFITEPNQHSPTNLQKISEFEERFDIILPETYKNFLLQTNGGKPKAVFFEFQENSSAVEYFFGLFNEPFWARLDTAAANYIAGKERGKDKGVIPIASVLGGQLVIRCSQGRRCGEICFKSTDWKLFSLARSFEEFITMLQEEV